MSTQTEHIGLHQWESSDSFLREDFNEDNRKIDEAVGLLRQITDKFEASGSYTMEQTTPVEVTLGFQPALVFILTYASNGYAMAVIMSLFFVAFAPPVAAITFGPKRVILVIGLNKVAQDVSAAVARARSTASPINAARFDIKTPCQMDGTCHNCNSPESICNYISIMRNSHPAKRHIVVLVGEDLGY